MEEITAIAIFVSMGVVFFGLSWRRSIYFIPNPSNNFLVKSLRFLFFSSLIINVILVGLKFAIVIMNHPSLVQLLLFLLTSIIIIVIFLLKRTENLSKINKQKEKESNLMKFCLYLFCLLLIIDTIIVV